MYSILTILCLAVLALSTASSQAARSLSDLVRTPRGNYIPLSAISHSLPESLHHEAEARLIEMGTDMIAYGPGGIVYDLRQTNPTVSDEIITLRASNRLDIDGVMTQSTLGDGEVILRKASDFSFYATILVTSGVQKVINIWAPGPDGFIPTNYLPTASQIAEYPGLFVTRVTKHPSTKSRSERFHNDVIPYPRNSTQVSRASNQKSSTNRQTTGSCGTVPKTFSKEIELAIAVGFDVCNSFNGNARETEAFILTHTRLASTAYERATCLVLGVTYIDMYCTQSIDPYTPMYLSPDLSSDLEKDGGALLDQFQEFWQQNRATNAPRDIAMLVPVSFSSTDDGGGGAVGVAAFPGACPSEGDSGYNWSNLEFPSTTSHEIGHNVNADHVEDLGVMDVTGNWKESNDLYFSQTSLNEIIPYIDTDQRSSCFSVLPLVTPNPSVSTTPSQSSTVSTSATPSISSMASSSSSVMPSSSATVGASVPSSPSVSSSPVAPSATASTSVGGSVQATSPPSMSVTPSASSSFVPPPSHAAPSTTSTRTATPSSSPSITPTSTNSPSPTSSMTTTATATVSTSPTSTPIPSTSPTSTTTPSTSTTPTSSESASPSTTPSSSVSASASPSTSAIPSASLSSTPSVSATPSTTSTPSTSATPSQTNPIPVASRTCGDTFSATNHVLCKSKANARLVLDNGNVKVKIRARYGTFSYLLKARKGYVIEGYSIIFKTSRAYPTQELEDEEDLVDWQRRKVNELYDTQISDFPLTESDSCCGRRKIFAFIRVTLCDPDDVCDSGNYRVGIRMKCGACAPNDDTFVAMSLRIQCPICI